MTRRSHELPEQRALKVLSELGQLLHQLPSTHPSSPEVAVRRLVAAAEALNLGIDQRTIEAIGRFSRWQMREVRDAAAEFRTDDAEHRAETRRQGTVHDIF